MYWEIRCHQNSVSYSHCSISLMYHVEMYYSAELVKQVECGFHIHSLTRFVMPCSLLISTISYGHRSLMFYSIFLFNCRKPSPILYSLLMPSFLCWLLMTLRAVRRLLSHKFVYQIRRIAKHVSHYEFFSAGRSNYLHRTQRHYRFKNIFFLFSKGATPAI